MEEINNWLNSGTSYWAGVALYEKYAGDALLITQLNKADHNFNQKKLIKCLESLIVVPEKVNYSANKPEVDKIKSDVPTHVLDMMDQRRIIHTELWHKSSEYERKIGCFKILSVSKKISNYYAGTENEEATEPEQLPEDRAKLIAKRNNNRAYISKNSGKISKTAEVKRRIEENEQIEALINGDSEK